MSDTTFLRDRDQTASFLGRDPRSIQDIFIAGPSLMMGTFVQGFFKQVIDHGGCARVLLPNPDLNAPAVLGLRGHWHHGREKFELFLKDLRAALKSIHAFST